MKELNIENLIEYAAILTIHIYCPECEAHFDLSYPENHDKNCCWHYITTKINAQAKEMLK